MDDLGAVLKRKLDSGAISQSEYDHLMGVDAEVSECGRVCGWISNDYEFASKCAIV